MLSSWNDSASDFGAGPLSPGERPIRGHTEGLDREPNNVFGAIPAQSMSLGARSPLL